MPLLLAALAQAALDLLLFGIGSYVLRRLFLGAMPQ